MAQKPKHPEHEDRLVIMQRRASLLKKSLMGLGGAAALAIGGCSASPCLSIVVEPDEEQSDSETWPEVCLSDVIEDVEGEAQVCLSNIPDVAEDEEPEAQICLSIMPDAEDAQPEVCLSIMPDVDDDQA